MYNIRYAAALSKQKGIKRPMKEEEEPDEMTSEEMSEASLEESDMML